MATAPDRGPAPSPSAETLSPVHPGEVLAEEFLGPLGLSQNEAARGMRVSPRRIHEIVRGRRAVTADTALRLARYFDTTPDFWINLQAHFDLEEARDGMGEQIAREVTAFRRTT